MARLPIATRESVVRCTRCSVAGRRAHVSCVSPMGRRRAPPSTAAAGRSPGGEAETKPLRGPGTMVILYARGSQLSLPRNMTPRLVLEARGVGRVGAHRHQSDAERTLRRNRIRWCRLT
jgi:hypothetical protein